MCEDIRKSIGKDRWKKIYSKYRYMENSEKVTQQEYDIYTDFIEECSELDEFLWGYILGRRDYLEIKIEKRLTRFKRMKEKGRLGGYTRLIKKCREYQTH